MKESSEDLLLFYQISGRSEKLIEAYTPFIKKYFRIFAYESIDFRYYDIRRLLACYISDPETIQELCRGYKYRPRRSVTAAYQALAHIKKAVSGMTYAEIYHELIILFLELARKYEDKGVGFHRYIYHCYRYHVIKFIDSKLEDKPREDEAHYKDTIHEDEAEYNVCKEDSASFKVWENVTSWDNMPTLDADDHEDLNNMLWQEGVTCSEAFKDMSFRDRFILVRHYQDGLTDKEVAVLTGLHHRSVYRARKRLTEMLEDKREKGELTWAKLTKKKTT